LIDKLDKQPKEAILNELSALGLADQSAFELVNIIEVNMIIQYYSAIDFIIFLNCFRKKISRQW
jgi:hypothetical protein